MSAASINGILDAVITELCGNQELRDLFVRNPGKDFTRDRKLSLETMLRAIIGMKGGSLSRELNDYDETLTVTSSAFIQQRDKILPEMFAYIFYEFNRSCEDTRTYRGYRLLAADGTGVSIATDENAPTYVENGSLAGYNCFHLNVLYDLCNHTYVDAHVEPRPEYNEVRAAVRMIERQPLERSIFIGDRGYGSLNLMEHIRRGNRMEFLIRVRNSWLRETKEMPMAELDTDLEIELRTTQRNEDKELYKTGKAKFIAGPSKHGKKKAYDAWDFESPCRMKLRVLRIQIAEDTYETIATSLDRSEFPLEEIRKLYHLRWGVETSFRALKYGTGLTNFHAKKESAVLQEIFAHLIMYNLGKRITLDVAITQKESRKYVYKVDFTLALHICREYFRKRGAGPPEVEKAIASHILPERPNRKSRRSMIKQKKSVSFLYRVA